MKNKILLFLPVVLLICFVVNDCGVVFAAEGAFSSTVGSSAAYDKYFSKVVEPQLLNLPVLARILSVVAVAVTGFMVLFDGGYSNSKTMRMLFGISLATQAAMIFMDGEGGWFAGKFNVPVQPVSPLPAIDFMNAPNIIGAFMTYFESICKHGAGLIAPTAFKILCALTVIDVTVTVMFKLDNDHFSYLMQQLIRVGFFVWLINEWLTGIGIAENILFGFEQIGIDASDGQAYLDSLGKKEGLEGSGLVVSNAIGNAIKMVTESWNNAGANGDLVVKFLSYCLVIAGGIMIALIVIEIVVARIEFWIFAMFGMIFIPFGAYSHTRFLFERVIGAIFNIGVKVGLLTFLMLIINPILAQTATTFMNAKDFSSSLGALLGMLFTIIVMFMLTRQAPALAAGLLSGSPHLGGSSLTSVAMGAAATAGGAVAGAAAGAGLVKAAYQKAKQDGEQGSSSGGGGDSSSADATPGGGPKGGPEGPKGETRASDNEAKDSDYKESGNPETPKNGEKPKEDLSKAQNSKLAFARRFATNLGTMAVKGAFNKVLPTKSYAEGKQMGKRLLSPGLNVHNSNDEGRDNQLQETLDRIEKTLKKDDK